MSDESFTKRRIKQSVEFLRTYFEPGCSVVMMPDPEETKSIVAHERLCCIDFHKILLGDALPVGESGREAGKRRLVPRRNSKFTGQSTYVFFCKAGFQKR